VSNPCQRTNAASAATSPSTIYRRIDRLTEAGLLDERTERDPAGHHRRVYECRLEEVSVAFDDAELRLELVRSRSSDSASWRANPARPKRECGRHSRRSGAGDEDACIPVAHVRTHSDGD
jgi:hypothetical protein